MSSPRLLVLLPFLSLLWIAGGVLAAGHFYPGYSHLSQFMSALGATGAPNGALVSLLVFAGAEVFVFLFVGLAARRLAGNTPALSGLLLLAAYAALLLIAAVFPCDFECRPVEPTQSHLIHVSAGLAAYAAGLGGLFLVSAGLGRDGRAVLPGKAMLAVPLAGAVLLAAMLFSREFAGLVQRLLELLIYLWMIRTGVVLARQKPENRPVVPA